METAKLLRAADGAPTDGPIEQWFLNSRYAQESYPTIIDRLYPNAAEQQAFLDRQLRIRQPGRAHELIADLAHRGAIRAIVTTNFDDLIERALRARGLDVQVIASEADFEHATPLIHCAAVRVYKPHGTLGVGRLRNTPSDIETLPPTVAQELQRALDDHGLIVVGYAGADPGLMAVLRARRRNLYPVYWMHREQDPPACIAPFRDTVVSTRIDGASTAFAKLLQIQDALARLSSTGNIVDPATAVEAIGQNRKDVAARIRGFMSDIADAISRLSPHGDDLSPQRRRDCDDVLVQAIRACASVTAAFQKLAAAAAEFDHAEACISLREEIHKLSHLYRISPPAASRDLVQFLSQQMFVVLVAELLKSRRWPSLQATLAALVLDDRGDAEGWTELNAHIPMLDQHRKQRLQLSRVSVAADLYRELHSPGGALATVATIQDIEDADFFLMFVSGFREPVGRPALGKWFPRMTLSTDRLPRWLTALKSRRIADEVLPIFEIPVGTPEERRQFFLEHYDNVRSINTQVWHDLWHGLGHDARRLREEFFGHA
jgi:hypothetical protein